MSNRIIYLSVSEALGIFFNIQLQLLDAYRYRQSLVPVSIGIRSQKVTLSDPDCCRDADRFSNKPLRPCGEH